MSKSESESLTLNLSLATDDVIEGALGGHQGKQAGGGHQQEEDRAHDGAGQFCNEELQKSNKKQTVFHLFHDLGGSETK